MEADEACLPVGRLPVGRVLLGFDLTRSCVRGVADALWSVSGVRRRRRVVDQADRTISTGQLHVLPRFHTRPIDVVVFHGSRRVLVLRGASRLDAFSGYPFRA